jgi:mevalonate kinase
MRAVSVSAPGKLHLIGEHTVVYGGQAIITAVNKRCFIDITPRSDGQICIAYPDLNINEIMHSGSVVSLYEKAQKDWEEFQSRGDIMILKRITQKPAAFLFICLAQALISLDTRSLPGLTLHIRNEIPLGAGMGSSAAFAVGICAAVLSFAGEPFDKQKINRLAFLVEQKVHGNPSGGDNTASCLGGCILYQKLPDRIITEQLPFWPGMHFFMVDSGKPAETTGEMVNFVKQYMQKGHVYKGCVDRIIKNQSRVAESMQRAIEEHNDELLKLCFRESEKNLEQLGVVSESTQILIRHLEKNGAAAKICGAGGKEKNSGVILGAGGNKEKITQCLASYACRYQPVLLGQEGVRVEKLPG